MSKPTTQPMAHRSTPGERFSDRYRQTVEDRLNEMAQIAPISWGYDAEGVLVLHFTDGRDNAVIEFTHPRSVLAFIHGYMDGFNDGYYDASNR